MPATPSHRHGPFPDLAIDAFLYGHQGPWPQPTRDHPFGMSPGIYAIPKPEWDDWQTYVGDYYLKNSAGFGIKAAEIALHESRENDTDYPDLTDEDFTQLLTEGLYSKFISPLDPQDAATFEALITQSDKYDYFKSDYTCMRVVKAAHPGEAVAASIALLRRPKNDSGFHYEVPGIVLQAWNAKDNAFAVSPVLTPTDGEAWKVARFFVLQGAIHRINLIDHTEVHFPPDTINAITKSVLPKDNLVLRLLQPHMWLSMCVNNTVLEGQRSLINRNTWYPWSPFVAKGDEVRKLLPFGWYGSQYYSQVMSPGEPGKDAYFDQPNSAYDRYQWDPTPPVIPSRYGAFLNAYFPPIRKFVRGVVEHMNATDWREIGYWAHHIAIWLPGFPDRPDLLGPNDDTPNKELLADTLAHFIWNASVRHSADHQSLHDMVGGRKDASGKLVAPPHAVPFVMRVQPPMSRSYKRVPVPLDDDKAHWFEKIGDLWDWLTNKTPLAWPSDLASAVWADLLFYMPHNSRCLKDVGVSMKDEDRNQNYAFDTPDLVALVDQFHQDLQALDEELAKDPDSHFVPLADIASSIQY
jgi:hypothetical protein